MSPEDLTAFRTDRWFSALPDRYRRQLLEHARLREVDAGTRLYRFGDPPNGLHALVAGELRLISYPADGIELVDKVVRPGQWFGELSVLDDKGRPHDAVAVRPSRVLNIAMPAIDEMTRRAPELWREFARLSCLHQRASLRDTERARLQRAETRLAAFLANAALASPDGVIGITQDEVAQIVATSRQHVNRLLKLLARSSLLEVGYGKIRVPDPQRLRAFARNDAQVSG